MNTIFEEIHTKYADDVYRFAYWLCGNRADAEEIAAETFLRLWTCRENIQAKTVKQFLLTIAKNLHVSRERKSRRSEPILVESPLDGQPRASQVVELRDEVRHAMELVMRLPLGEREAFLLRVQQELSYDEIANCLGISTSAVKLRIHRARLKILSQH
jgi:RNA polymerase sigma-70 factor (ECF subfamily)